MNDKWQKGIGDLKNIKLSQSERGAILERILSRSPYTRQLSVFARSLYVARSHVAVFVVLVLVVATSGISYAAEGSLPGDLLYPLKVDITEPLRDIVQILPEQKVEWEVEKANRRIAEVEALVVKQKFDEYKKQKVETLFEKHTERLVENAERQIKIEVKKSVEKEGASVKTKIKTIVNTGNRTGDKTTNTNSDNSDAKDTEKIKTEIWSKIEKQKEEISKEQKETREENDKKRSEIEKEVKERIEKARENIDKRLKELQKEKERVFEKSRKEEKEED